MTACICIDTHMHLGPAPGFHAPWGSLEQVIRVMDMLHTEVGIFSWMPLIHHQFDAGYDQTLRALDSQPDRLRAYSVFNPNWLDESLRHMERMHQDPRFVGIKIHPAIHAIAPDDERYDELWSFAHTHDLVVLTHSWSRDPGNPNQELSMPERFAVALARWPRVKLILGHGGGRDEGRRQSVRLMQQFPGRVWADLSGDEWAPGTIEWLALHAGADRLLYGTDCNWIEPRYVFGHVLKAAITPAQKARIFRDNALELFGARLGQLHRYAEVSA